ncbi:ATP-binding cassette domain-containing protein [Amycolatopsis sp. OK19-0408]|uniref:UvrABC system protein A n=1 Tax=Amycolatopsis iheyensis TaxID=2945988 RepID=A0A9X2N916_9PSEU|nr:ATP-binding cassette domain-containing protein [Amycolatopsis iheyensis]MCR6482811.1 ATP-binding cassette domain-containing protein [Amycolatopsis iheyensis]
MPSNVISLRGVRTHNLADVDVDIPKHRLVAVTGVSGSGKSSLAFATLAAESRRQLYSTMPAFVRTKLPHDPRPEASSLQGLTTVVVVDQRPLGTNSRSTVGTATEVWTMLRMLFSRLGEPSAGYSPAYSFNDPSGMCPACSGLGTVTDIDGERMIDRDRTLNDGAMVFPSFAVDSWIWKRYVYSGFFDNDLPLREWPEELVQFLLHGETQRPPDPLPRFPRSAKYQSMVPRIRRLLVEREAKPGPAVRAALAEVTTQRPCPDCGGSRLAAPARESRVHGVSIVDLGYRDAPGLLEFCGSVDHAWARPLVEQLRLRLESMITLGLGHLQCYRGTPTLSGGESQRLKLVRHLGSSLTDLTYVLDEPTDGLHPADVASLVDVLRRLRDHGNTVLVVDHHQAVVEAADHVIDLGPGAGEAGGHVVFHGTPAKLRKADTTTGRALRTGVRLKDALREPAGWLPLRGLDRHTLAGIDVDVPTGVLTAITGVAGSGKSTLAGELAERHPRFTVVDQSQITATARSTVGTWLGLADPVQRAFAEAGGLPPKMFNPRSEGGCPACRGTGVRRTDLAFLEDVATPCEQCDATGFRAEALVPRLAGRTVLEVLETPVSALPGYVPHPDVARLAGLLEELGLGHLACGRTLDTLSGGERQRLKLARQLDSADDDLLVDEPTAGLHPSDTRRLVTLLGRLVDEGRTVVVVEHSLHVVAAADWVVDLGPGAGEHGGHVLYTGTPKGLAEHGGPTGRYFRAALDA